MGNVSFEGILIIFLHIIFVYHVNADDISFVKDSVVNQLQKELLPNADFEKSYSLHNGDYNTICWNQKTVLHIFSNGTNSAYVEYSISLESSQEISGQNTEVPTEQYTIIDEFKKENVLDFVTVETNEEETVKENTSVVCKTGQAYMKLYEQIGTKRKIEIKLKTEEEVGIKTPEYSFGQRSLPEDNVDGASTTTFEEANTEEKLVTEKSFIDEHTESQSSKKGAEETIQSPASQDTNLDKQFKSRFLDHVSDEPQSSIPESVTTQPKKDVQPRRLGSDDCLENLMVNPGIQGQFQGRTRDPPVQQVRMNIPSGYNDRSCDTQMVPNGGMYGETQPGRSPFYNYDPYSNYYNIPNYEISRPYYYPSNFYDSYYIPPPRYYYVPQTTLEQPPWYKLLYANIVNKLNQ